MTLSRFLRDFLYIPLGGNRGSTLMTYRNLMITMVLGGLWHGAAWTFVIWGAFHGTCLILEHMLGGKLKAPAWLRWFVTFQLVVFGWIIFRSQSVAELWAFLKRFGSPGAPTLWTAPVIAAILVTIAPQLLPERPFDRLQDALGRLNPILLGTSLGVLILFVAATVGSQGVPPFIYFRF
jgi:D-alanyl-lipoteichoic acid acyltransferase DltB (MBOAT superfamily)